MLSLTQDKGVIPQDEVGRRNISSSNKTKYWRVYPNDIVYNTMRMWQGASARSDYFGIVSPAYTVCCPVSGASSRFLSYALKLPEHIKIFRARSQGLTSDVWNLRFEELAQIELKFVPSYAQQELIATILSSVDHAIEKTQAVINQVQVVKRCLMQELLTRGLPGRHTRFKQTEIGEIPEDWGSPALGDIASIGNGTTPSKKREDYWQDGTIPWLPTGKVNDRIVQSASVYVTEKAILETPLRVLPINTLLIAMIGQGKTRGKTAFLKIKACINQNFAYVIPLRQISSRFLFYVLEHQYVALRASGRGSNQDALNCQIIKKFKVPLPTSDEQTKIAKALRILDDRLDLEQRRVEFLGNVKSALMSVLLTGELRVTPHKETA